MSTTPAWLPDTDRSNLNSKVKYLSLALSLNILFLLLVVIGFNTCKVGFGIVYLVTITIVRWFGLRMELYMLSRRHDQYS